MGSLIKKHNSKTFSPTTECNDCDCGSLSECPVNANCLKTNIIDQATIETEKTKFTHTLDCQCILSSQVKSDYLNFGSKA